MAAVIRIEIATSGDVGQVKKDLQDVGKAAEDSGKGFSAMQEIATGALRAVGEGLVGLAVNGFGALKDAVADGIADAKETVQLNAQTAAVLESTGNAAGVSAEHISDYASALSDAAGKSLFGDDQIQQSENLLLTFTNIKGKALDAATAMTVDMAQALGGAPKDAAIQLGKALNDPVKGITALTRVGVTFTEEQKAQIQAMTEAGDTAGAQQVILDELNKEFGGSAEAAAKATGGWSEFNGRMGEAKEAIGAALLPLLNDLAGVLLNNVMPVIESLAASVGPAIESLQPIIANIQSLIGGMLASFANTSPMDTFTAASTALGTFWSTTLAPALQTVWTVLQTQVWPILSDLATALFPLLNAAVQIAASFWTNVLVPSLQMLWSILTTVVLPVLGALASWLAQFLPPAIQMVSDFLSNILFPALGQVYAYIQANVIPILQQVAQWLIANIPIAIQAAVDFFNTVLLPALNAVWAFISTVLIPIIMDVVTWFQTNIPIALQAAADFWNNVLLPAINAVWAFLNTYVIPLIRAFIAVELAALNLAIRFVVAIWNNELLPAITAIWNFIQKNLMPVIQTFITLALDPLMKSIHDIAFFILGTLTPWLQALGKEVSGPLAGAFSTMQSMADAAVGALRSIGDAVKSVISWLSDLASKLSSISVPDWLQGHSPPPMADWFSYISDSVKAVNAELPAFQANLAAQVGPGGQSISNTSNSRTFTYAPTINSTGGEHMPMDLSLATSLAGV